VRESDLTAAAAATPKPRIAYGGYVLAALVLLASLWFVLSYWRTAHQRELNAAETEFVARTDELTALLRQRVTDYELVTRGGVSLFASVARPSRKQWQDYVEGLDVRARFPAMVGLGFALYATPGELADLQRSLRDAGEGLFEVRPRGPRAYYGATFFLEPGTAENLAAIGQDMYASPVRHAAMEAALETGQARLSGPEFGRRDATSPPEATVVLFQPVYRAGDHPMSIAARRESMQGWVYLPFRVGAFVDAALRAGQRQGQVRITDVTDAQPHTLFVPPGFGTTGAAFRHTGYLDVYGRRWRLDFESRPLAQVEAGISGLRTTVATGLVASLLLFGIVLVLVRTQVRAERLAARMSESYRRSEQRFRAAMQYSAIGKALLDREGHVVEANPSLARILGTTPEALVGTVFGSHFVEGRIESTRSGELQALGGGAYRSTRALRRGDGEVRQAQLTFAPVPGEIGQDIVRLVQVEDVTDRVRAEAQVIALNRSLEARVALRTRELTQANEELEAFAYSVSHDLRAPLRAIDGFSRLLSERYGDRVDAIGREYLVRVRNAAARMGELIESLLKMSRVGRGGMHPVELDLSRMASDIIADLRATDPDRPVEAVIADGLHATGDAGLVRSLLQNLLGNAWKFTAGHADARIEVGRDDQGFFVRDNGAGFEAEYADKLFRPFQRLHSQDEFAGHGIGLASVKRIVERHGGAVSASGRPGEGASFHFTLPDPLADN